MSPSEFEAFNAEQCRRVEAELGGGFTVHPDCAWLPWMTADEMEDLVEDIKPPNRLIMPIVLDKNGVLLDGKCRLKACQIAGVEPSFETFDGFDSRFPGSREPYEEQCRHLIYQANLLRVSLNPSQRAIAKALAEARGVVEPNVLPEARAVARDHHLAECVRDGIYSLAQAYEQVLQQEKRARWLAEGEAKKQRFIAHLRNDGQGLVALQVEEGTLDWHEAEVQVLGSWLAEEADAIRQLGKRIIADAIEIGRRLVDCKKVLGHGYWLPWLEREFQWGESTALNFMRAHELSLKSPNIEDLELPLSGVYLLAAPSTPEAVRSDVLARAEAGERVKVADIKRLISEARPRPNGHDDHLADLRKIIDRLASERPDDPLVEQLRALVLVAGTVG